MTTGKQRGEASRIRLRLPFNLTDTGARVTILSPSPAATAEGHDPAPARGAGHQDSKGSGAIGSPQPTESWIDSEHLHALIAKAPTTTVITMTAAETADLQALGGGSYHPLDGFMGAADYSSCVTDLRLRSGALWPIPITLGLADDASRPADLVVLRDPAGVLQGTLEVRDVFERDREREAALVYGTTDPAHPGVARVLAAPRRAVGGPVRVVRSKAPLGVEGYVLTPRETRAVFEERGWRTIVAFQTRNPVHRAHEYIQKCALELVDGLLLHPLVGPTKDGDIPADVRMRAYEAVLAHYYPAQRVLLAALVAPMRYAGPREAVLHALVRRNYGCTHFIVGRDHAGVGAYYGTYEAQELILSLSYADLGITPLPFDNAFFCSRCQAMATAKSCPHDASCRIELSGTQVRAMLAAGQIPPPEFSRPEVAAALIAAHREKGR